MLAKTFEFAEDYIKWLQYLSRSIEIISVIEFGGEIVVTYKYI